MAGTAIAEGSPLHEYLNSIGYDLESDIIYKSSDSVTMGDKVVQVQQPSTWYSNLKDRISSYLSTESFIPLKKMCVLAYSSYLGAQGFLLENDFDWICAIVGDNFINLTSENSIPNRNNYSNSKLPKSSRYQWLFDQSFQELSTSSLGLKYKAKKSLWSGFLFGFASISIKYLSPFQNRFTQLITSASCCLTGYYCLRTLILLKNIKTINQLTAQHTLNVNRLTQFSHSVLSFHKILVQGLRKIQEQEIVSRGFATTSIVSSNVLPPLTRLSASSTVRGNLSIQSCVVDCLKQFIQECNTLGLSVLKVVQVPNVFDPLINYLFSNSPQIPLTNNTTLNYLETIKALLHIFLSYRSQLTRRLVLGFQLVSIPFKCQNEQLYTDHQDNHLFFEPNKYNLLDTSLPQVKRDELSEQYFAQISSLLSPLCQLLEGETVLLTRVLGEKASTRQDTSSKSKSESSILSKYLQHLLISSELLSARVQIVEQQLVNYQANTDSENALLAALNLLQRDHSECKESIESIHHWLEAKDLSKLNSLSAASSSNNTTLITEENAPTVLNNLEYTTTAEQDCTDEDQIFESHLNIEEDDEEDNEPFSKEKWDKLRQERAIARKKQLELEKAAEKEREERDKLVNELLSVLESRKSNFEGQVLSTIKK